MDCSGSVVELETVAIVNGKFPGDELESKLKGMAKRSDQDEITIEKHRETLSLILSEALENISSGNPKKIKTTSNSGSGNGDDLNDERKPNDVPKFKLPMRIVSASFSRKDGLVVERRLADMVEPGETV
jgi:hypothetical protein